MRTTRITGFLAALMLCGAALDAQMPIEEQRKLARAYLAADEARARELALSIEALPPLSKAEAQAWTEWVVKTLRGLGPTLDSKGTSYLYDREAKRGKYIVAGADHRKGLVFGLHGGGVGQADAGGAAGAWRSAIEKAGMIGIFPEAIEPTEAAWGDDVTVQFMLDLLAAARRTFTFDPDRVYVVGHSMGGYGAWTWGGRFCDRFAGAVSFAGAPTPIFGDDQSVIGIQPGVLPNLFNLPVWVYHSADDPQVPIAPTRFAVQELKALQAAHGGYVFHYEEEDKQGHAFPPNGPNPALAWITRKKRDTTPRRIVWEPFYERPDQSYWFLYDAPRRGAPMHASWDGKRSFDLSGDVDADKAGVLLRDDMCDLDQAVTITVHGKPAFNGPVRRSLAVLLLTARRRADPGLLFTALARPRAD